MCMHGTWLLPQIISYLAIVLQTDASLTQIVISVTKG